MSPKALPANSKSVSSQSQTQISTISVTSSSSESRLVLSSSVVNSTEIQDSLKADSTLNAPPQFVIHISIDGLASEALDSIPSSKGFARLFSEGVYTTNARSERVSTSTLPNHTSQVTSLPVEGESSHGIMENSYIGTSIEVFTGKYKHSVFSELHDRGYSTAMFAGKSKLSLLVNSWDSTHGHPDTIGVDNGRDKIDVDFVTTETPLLVDTLFKSLREGKIHYYFFHDREPDMSGHAVGWNLKPTSMYMQSVIETDFFLDSLLTYLSTDSLYKSNTVLILTSDHGGSMITSHADTSYFEHHKIPFFVWGKNVAEGQDLYLINTLMRQNPMDNLPPALSSPPPIRNGEVGNLVMQVFSLPPIQGSYYNAMQDLNLK